MDQNYLHCGNITIQKPSFMMPGLIYVGLVGFHGNGGEQVVVNYIEFEKHLEAAYKFITVKF